MDCRQALEILRAGLPLENRRIDGELDLTELASDEEIHVPIVIRNAEIESLVTMNGYFQKPVVLERVRFAGEVSFWCGYFFAGFSATDCEFGGLVGFENGGHNRDGSEFRLKDCVFRKFVNFLDCWYEGPVYVQGCRFEEGTNLLGMVDEPCRVSFDVTPIIENNVGNLALNQDWSRA